MFSCTLILSSPMSEVLWHWSSFYRCVKDSLVQYSLLNLMEVVLSTLDIFITYFNYYNLLSCLKYVFRSARHHWECLKCWGQGSLIESPLWARSLAEPEVSGWWNTPRESSLLRDFPRHYLVALLLDELGGF